MDSINRKTYLKLMGSFVAGGLLPYKPVNTITDIDSSSNLMESGDLIYENPLSTESDISDFRLEGHAHISFTENRMRMENKLPPSEGQRANFVHWCPEDFPADLRVEWDFYPVREPGLCILFFAATGLNGESIFDPSLPKREGIYKRYHSGEMNAYHISYFRRKHPAERAFQTCNLRKSKGFHMVAKGADPIPSIKDVDSPYRIKLAKKNGLIEFGINDLTLLSWQDDEQHGKILGKGKIGFRQMAPLIAEYANMAVYQL